MPWTQTDTSFKKLQNKRITTSTGKGIDEEKGASALELYLPDIKTDLIPGTPPGATTAVLAYTGSIGQTLAVDTSVPSNLTWFATSGYGNTTSANDGSAGSENQRLGDWISDKYDAFGTVSGAGYEIKVYDKDSNLITKADPSDWLFDYQTGILVFNNASTAYGAVSSSGPFRVVGYRYIGQKGVISGSYGGSGFTTYTLGDLLVGAGSTLIKFPVGSDNYVLTADSSQPSGLRWAVGSGGGAGLTLNGLTASTQYFVTGTSGSGFNISSSGSTHTFNIPIAGAGATGLVSTLAQTFAGQKTFTSAIIGDLSGIATTAGLAITANYSHQAGYAITSGFATTADYSYQSGYAITSGLATTSTYAYESGYATTSGLATSAGLATTATYAHQSGYATTSGLATTAGFATTASYAIQSGYAITAGLATTATYAHQSGYAITSGFATTASYSYQSGYGITSGFATTAGLATTATYSHQSGYATTSGFATTASYSYQSGYATTSGLATTATYSHQSGYGITSGFATTAANLNVSNASTGTFFPVLSNTASSTSGIAASVNSLFSFNAANGAFGATSINIFTGQSYSIGGNSVLSSSSLGTGVTNSSLTALGTITTGVWAGTLITAFYGGTGYNSYTKGDILVGAGNTFIKLNVGTDNFVLTADNTTPSGVKWTSVAGLSITSINSLTASAQFFSTGSSGTGFNISSSGSTHTFNIPIASTGATGLVSTLAQSFAGIKTFTNDVIISSSTGSTAFNTGALTVYGGVGVSGQLSFNQAALGYTGATNPSIAFIGSTTAAPITLTVLSDNSLLWEGTSGKLFGINNNLSSGWIFNVGDISGLPIIRANADGTIAMAEFTANVGIGLSNPSYKLHVVGDTNLSSGYVYRINGASVLSSTTLGTGVTNSSLTSVGIITSGTWSGSTITSLYGGTGHSNYSTGDLLVGAGSTLLKLAVGNNNFLLVADSAVPGGVKWANVSGFAITNINGLTASKQDLAFGYSGTVPAFSSSGNTHTLNIPLAGTGSTGLVSTQAQSFAGIKTFTNAVSITDTTGSSSYTSGALVVSGGVGIAGTLNVQGDFNVQGTFTTINSTTVNVADKNIELGVVATPTDVTAQGGGITLRGATDKSINWYSGVGWSSSESWNLASGNTYKINNTTVLSATSLGTGVTNSSLTAVGTITTGVWSGTAITALYGGTGLVPTFTVGDILYANTANTWGRLTANSNSGYVLTSAGSGATPTYVAPSTLSVGFATTSSYSYQSGYGITSGFATTSSYAYQSGYGITSGFATTAGSATTATYALQSGYGITSGFATTAGLATTATYAHQSGYATTSGLATTANYAHQSGYAITSGSATTATYAHQSGYATTSGLATTATYAHQSGYATTSGLATTATYAHQSGYAITSGYGITSGFATTAGLATTATYAHESGYAITSGFATTAANINVVAANSNTVHQIIFTPTSGTGSGVAVSSRSTVNFNPFTDIMSVSGLAVTSSTTSTSSSSGALIVTGGVGIGGSLFSSTQYSSSISGVAISNGVIYSGTWAGSTITGLYGGTGYTTYTTGDLLVGAGSTFIKVGLGSTNYVLSSNSVFPGGIGWTHVTAVGIGTSPPSNEHNADLWWNSTDGSLNVYYSDGDTDQWVEIAGGSGIDLSQPVHITSTVGSTNVTTGALIVDGGVGIQGELHTASLVINGTYDVVGTSITLSGSGASQEIFSLDASIYRSVKYMIQTTRGTNYQVQEALVLQDGTDAYLTQYAQLLSLNNLVLATFDVDLSGGNMRLLADPTYTNTTFKIYGTAVRL